MSTLYDLNINKTATIHSLDNSYESTARLSEMGVIPGSVVRVVKKNPFGGPLQLKLNNYYIAIFSHRDYVFYQEFSDGNPIGEQGCDCITNLKDIDFYGYGLNKISNINYIEVLTSSLNLVDYLLKNHDLLVAEKKHISEISPIYLTKND